MGAVGLFKEDIPYLDEVGRIYRISVEHPSYQKGMGPYPFPSFEELFEELITLFIEERTKLRVNEIDEELYQLKRKGMLDVEHGFVPELYGLNKESELLSALSVLNLPFTHNGAIFNSPLQEVW